MSLSRLKGRRGVVVAVDQTKKKKKSSEECVWRFEGGPFFQGDVSALVDLSFYRSVARDLSSEIRTHTLALP